ncbi:polyprenyl synthetase family protein [Nocardia inohanensis]|uniref:polyprenyl synthetase family protein n=1 Tax=Nocardia inohanensis TaxID=209246 RepID=UPI00082E4A96|nr:polyprenyl synthetase family protein [Nocardia inohanensis]
MSSSTAADPAFGTGEPVGSGGGGAAANGEIAGAPWESSGSLSKDEGAGGLRCGDSRGDGSRVLRRGGARGGAHVLRRAQRLTAPLLREAVDNLPEELRHMVGYQLGWWDVKGVVTQGYSGKGVRPALVLAAAAATGCGPGRALHAAAAVELVHNFTLVHDDVMNGDAVRRGRPAVWRVWGAGDAVLVGDALHSLAIGTLAGGPAAALAGIVRLEEAIIEVCLAQHHDCAFGQPAEVSPAERSAAGHKRAALYGSACALGALCADADPETVDAVDRFGRELGVASQPAEDVLGRSAEACLSGIQNSADLRALADYVLRRGR